MEAEMADYQTTERRDSMARGAPVGTGTGTTNPPGAQKVGVYDRVRAGGRTSASRWIIWAVVALVVILGLVYWFSRGDDTTTTTPAATPPATTAPATTTGAAPGGTVAPADQPPPTTAPANQ
jgi:hypothetical protein